MFFVENVNGHFVLKSRDQRSTSPAIKKLRHGWRTVIELSGITYWKLESLKVKGQGHEVNNVLCPCVLSELMTNMGGKKVKKVKLGKFAVTRELWRSKVKVTIPDKLRHVMRHNLRSDVYTIYKLGGNTIITDIVMPRTWQLNGQRSRL